MYYQKPVFEDQFDRAARLNKEARDAARDAAPEHTVDHHEWIDTTTWSDHAAGYSTVEMCATTGCNAMRTFRYHPEGMEGTK